MSALNGFQSYQSRQINPDMVNLWWCFPFKQVSIVSIHTDQSRRLNFRICFRLNFSFNRINPNRSIPTIVASFEVQNPKKHRFQSHQSKQINPDTKYLVWIYLLVSCFNRINPNRSIPTFKTYLWFSYRNWSFNRINPNRSIPTPDKVEIDRRALVFQSYQSKQINPDTLLQKTY